MVGRISRSRGWLFVSAPRRLSARQISMGALTERKRAMPNERKIAELEYQRSEMLRERRDLSIAGAVDRTLHAEIADIERRIAALKGEKPAAQTAKPAAPVAKPVPIAKP